MWPLLSRMIRPRRKIIEFYQIHPKTRQGSTVSVQQEENVRIYYKKWCPECQGAWDALPHVSREGQPGLLRTLRADLLSTHGL